MPRPIRRVRAPQEKADAYRWPPQIVREQCWLNEALTGCQWSTEGLLTVPEEEDTRDDQVTDSDLQAILDGPPLPLFPTPNSPH